MTSKLKFFKLWLYAYETKARNPGNTVKAENSLFDLLMTSYDLQSEILLTMALSTSNERKEPRQYIKSKEFSVYPSNEL